MQPNLLGLDIHINKSKIEILKLIKSSKNKNVSCKMDRTKSEFQVPINQKADAKIKETDHKNMQRFMVRLGSITISLKYNFFFV